MAEKDIPPFLRRPLASQPISQGRELPSGQMAFEKPEYVGIRVEVQHPVGKGEVTEELGIIGVGLALTPRGPRIILNITHPDGTSMGAFMNDQDYAGFTGCLIDVARLMLASEQAPQGNS